MLEWKRDYVIGNFNWLKIIFIKYNLFDIDGFIMFLFYWLFCFDNWVVKWGSLK